MRARDVLGLLAVGVLLAAMTCSAQLTVPPPPLLGTGYNAGSTSYITFATSAAAGESFTASPPPYTLYGFNSGASLYYPLAVDSSGNLIVTGGGTTTHALTAAASGGGAPGSAFNGASALTWDAHTLGGCLLTGCTMTGTLVNSALTGGTIDSAIIGGTTAAAGTFTTATAANFIATGGSLATPAVTCSVNCQAGLQFPGGGALELVGGGAIMAYITSAAFSTNGTPMQAGSYQAPLTTPASSSASCSAGTVAWDAGFVYVCTATNTWKRAALSTF